MNGVALDLLALHPQEESSMSGQGHHSHTPQAKDQKC